MNEELLDNNVLFFGATPLDLIINFPDMIYDLLKIDTFQDKGPTNTSLIGLFISDDISKIATYSSFDVMRKSHEIYEDYSYTSALERCLMGGNAQSNSANHIIQFILEGSYSFNNHLQLLKFFPLFLTN